MAALRVLLVDDEEELVATLQERLSLRGISAHAVTSGHEALELMATQSFDVVVADLKMPGLGGLEVIDTIARKHPEVKFFLVTGHGADLPELSTVVERECEILLKPFDIETLLEKIYAVSGR